MINEQRFENFEKLSTQLLNDSRQVIVSTTDGGARSSIFLSGGTTPAPFYRRLSEQDLPWQQISIGLVDERWLDRDHDASNEKLLLENMFRQQAAAATLVPMKNTATSAREGEQLCQQRYQQLFDNTQPCLAILGMGNDGHTASLFPYADGLSAALSDANEAPCAAIYPSESEVTGAYTERMSLTVSALKKTKHLALLLVGAKKWLSYEAAKADGPIEAMPIRALLRDPNCTVHVYWCP